MLFYTEIQICIVFIVLKSSASRAGVEGYEKGVTFLHKWDVPLNISEDCFKFHLIESHGVILKICSRHEQEVRSHVHPSKTHIETIDPTDDPVSCTIPNFLANEVAALGNRKIVMQDYLQILIIEIHDCTFKTMLIKSHGIIPQKSSFHVMIKSPRNDNQSLFKGPVSVKQYDDEGKLIAEYINVTQERGELVYQGQSTDESSGRTRYFFIQDVSRYSNRWGVIDIFDDAFHKMESEPVWPYVEAYSTAHGNFSICYEETGLRCVLYNETFQPLHYVIVTHTGRPEALENYYLANMHNLLGGGSLIMFCEKVTDEFCRLYFAVIDEQGRLFGDQYFSIESLYADGGHVEPFTMHINSVFKPKIFEIHAAHGIYCLVFPRNDSIHGLGITVRKILKTPKH